MPPEYEPQGKAAVQRECVEPMPPVAVVREMQQHIASAAHAVELQAANKSLEARLVAAEKEKQQHCVTAAELVGLRSANAALEARLEAREKEMQQHSGTAVQVAELQAAKESLEAKLSQAERENQKLAAQVESLPEQMQATWMRFQARINELEEALRAELEAKSDALRAELEGTPATELVAQQEVATECSAMAAAGASVAPSAAAQKAAPSQDEQMQHQQAAQLQALVLALGQVRVDSLARLDAWGSTRELASQKTEEAGACAEERFGVLAADLHEQSAGFSDSELSAASCQGPNAEVEELQSLRQTLFTELGTLHAASVAAADAHLKIAMEIEGFWVVEQAASSERMEAEACRGDAMREEHLHLDSLEALEGAVAVSRAELETSDVTAVAPEARVDVACKERSRETAEVTKQMTDPGLELEMELAHMATMTTEEDDEDVKANDLFNRSGLDMALIAKAEAVCAHTAALGQLEAEVSVSKLEVESLKSALARRNRTLEGQNAHCPFLQRVADLEEEKADMAGPNSNQAGCSSSAPTEIQCSCSGHSGMASGGALESDVDEDLGLEAISELASGEAGR